jgi:hypothetical protein
MGVHRHLYGDMDEVQVTVVRTVTVKPGDLMFLYDTAQDINGSIGTKVPDNYAYPWAASGGTHATQLGHSGNSPQASFIGVAMDDSPSDTTTTISVATKGVFRFPLTTKGAVTVGAMVSSEQPGGFDASNSTTASYQVKTAKAAGSIGYCVKTESGASNVDFRVRTLLGDGLIS